MKKTMKYAGILTSITLLGSFTCTNKPFFSNPKTMCNFKRAQNIINELYKRHTIDGFGASEEITTMIAKHGGNATYGEITPASASTLIKDLKLTENDTFYDLGCGVGKFCIQVALTTPATSIGIELSPKRYTDAQQAQKILQQEYNLNPGDRLQFIEQNILDATIKPNATIYLCSTCFPEKLLTDIVSKIKKVPGPKRIISTKELPGLTATKTYTLPMTWTKKGSVYFYVIR